MTKYKIIIGLGSMNRDKWDNGHVRDLQENQIKPAGGKYRANQKR